MNEHDARNLAERITRSWRGAGIGTDVWYEILLDLHHGPAEQAFRTLRDNEEHQPPVAKFRSTYRNLLGTHYEPPTPCDICGGDGWETTHYTIAGREHEGLKPCRCRNGRGVEDVHRRIINSNDSDLRNTGHIANPDAIGPPPGVLTPHRYDQELF